MKKWSTLSRREFVKATGGSMLTAGISPAAGRASLPAETPPENELRVPLKIGHRAASMKMVGDFEVFQAARQIPGLLGVELQVAAGQPSLRDLNAVRRYKKEANRWGMIVPSVAGIWDQGVSILRSPVAEINLLQSIRAAELLGASVVLVAFFRDKAPEMDQESSYGPVVELHQKAAPKAAAAGIVLGLENSLSPADNKKLVDLIDRPNVQVYYDLHNMAHYGHGDQAIPGISLLGKERICQVHVKNGSKLIEEAGPIDWPAAFRAFNGIGYEGWYIFESQHFDRNQMVEATTRNIKFIERHCRMPLALEVSA